MSTSKDRYATAIHEAGHAVVGLVTGARVASLVVDGRGEITHGYARMRYRRNGAGEKSTALVTLAGYAAEWLYQSGGDVKHVRAALLHGEQLGTAEDFVAHRRLVELAGRKQRGPVRYSREHITEGAIGRTIRLVQRNWFAINEIADHLARLGKLSGETVEVLYELANVNPLEV
ncbi:hypothetical protein ETAA8_06580 [Anatilimnocola aggregata]|uniref:Peptidase M41 domain-containing protein n=1 Tax=Anatilimnocola aggregata TaxID=2528021 RepID=A0A517Y5S3_9BACT|nr:M50 family metallopeptidase [Anatilimnocola aggregata]QDU25588.1 hypothetical protein ETAA8_06580 [Anatilimnocola aggregata]